MEALAGVNVALLTIYDMCKAVDKSMEMSHIYLEHKSGGKSGEFYNEVRRQKVKNEGSDGKRNRLYADLHYRPL